MLKSGVRQAAILLMFGTAFGVTAKWVGKAVANDCIVITHSPVWSLQLIATDPKHSSLPNELELVALGDRFRVQSTDGALQFEMVSQ